jgi:hypothetical protein
MRRRLLRVLAALLVVPFLPFSVHTAHKLIAIIHPATLDRFALAADAAIVRAPVGQWVGFASESFPALGWMELIAYAGIPLALQAAVARELGDTYERRPFPLLPALVTSAVLGLLGYVLVPVAGPRYLLGDSFAAQLQLGASVDLTWQSMDAAIPRNGIPSLHTTWAVLLTLWAQPGRERLTSAAFLVLTVLATLGLGQHYAVDLLMSAPFVVLVVAITNWMRWSDPAAGACAAALSGVTFSVWIATIYLGLPALRRSEWLGPFITVSTLALTVVAWRMLRLYARAAPSWIGLDARPTRGVAG